MVFGSEREKILKKAKLSVKLTEIEKEVGRDSALQKQIKFSKEVQYSETKPTYHLQRSRNDQDYIHK